MNRPARVVFDCMVFLQASTRPQVPAARLFIDHVEGGDLALYVSDAILDEVRHVLGRPQIRAKNPSLTDEAVEEFFDRIGQVAQKIENVPASFTLACDPDDGPYLNLALAAATDYLVTRDQDMLDLMQDAGFRSRYPALIILTPVALLQVLAPPRSRPGRCNTLRQVVSRTRQGSLGVIDCGESKTLTQSMRHGLAALFLGADLGPRVGLFIGQCPPHLRRPQATAAGTKPAGEHTIAEHPLVGYGNDSRQNGPFVPNV